MDPQTHHTRPRSKSTFSFKSQNSQGSDPNRHEKKASTSTHQRKESDTYKPHLNVAGKADPNAAMNEVQPIAAALEKPTLQSLRSFQHTDKDGVPIADPDLSNPTRSRWERPLDTIRSFEAAIDGEYRRRARTMRDSTTEVMSGYTSRRSSYYGGGANFDQGRFSQVGGYYGNRQAARDSWVDNGHGMGGPVGGMGGPPRTRYNRMQSDPGWNRYSHGHGQGQGNGVYPVQGYHQSRDTVNTNGSSGSHSEPYSTDPSSENSSIERSAGGMKPDMGEQYGFNGFGAGPVQKDFQNALGPSNGYAVQRPNGTLNYGAPPVPMKQGPPAPPPHANKPIKLTKLNDASSAESRPPPVQHQDADKRKSWFKRRFSKD